jgi:hypothetical protein
MKDERIEMNEHPILFSREMVEAILPWRLEKGAGA